jgi:hypothetical protein
MSKLKRILEALDKGEVEDMSKIPTPTVEMYDFFMKRTNAHIKRVSDNIHRIMKLDRFDNVELAKRAVLHDRIKFMDEEFEPYVYGTEMYRCRNNNLPFEYPEGMKDKFDEASHHHVINSPHHPEYHNPSKAKINKDDRDKSSGAFDASKMDICSIIEMVCDWKAMAEERNENGGSAKGWADKRICSHTCRPNENTRWIFDRKQVEMIYDLISELDKEMK